MNPHAARVVLRPRGPLEVFDLATRLVRARWREIAWLSVPVVGPPVLLLTALSWWFDGHPALVLLALALTLPVQAPYTVLAGRLLFADQVRARDVLRDLLRTPGALVATWVVSAFGLLSVVLTGGLLAPIVLTTLFFLHETALLERTGMLRALRRSGRLAGGRLTTAIAGALGYLVFTLWFAALGETVGQALFGFLFQFGAPVGRAQDLQATPFLLAGIVLGQPWYAIWRLLLYVDVRTRAEGWDLQVALRAAALREVL